LTPAGVDGGKQLREHVRLVSWPYRNEEYLYRLFLARDEDFAGLQAKFNRMDEQPATALEAGRAQPLTTPIGPEAHNFAGEPKVTATQEGRMEKSEEQVLWELIKLPKTVLKKEPDLAKKRGLREWIKDGLRQMRIHEHARNRAFARVRHRKGRIGRVEVSKIA
jgi:hypothetical protein